MQTFQADFQALSKYSPVTFHYSPATAIFNETPGIFIHHILEIKPFLKLRVSSTCWPHHRGASRWDGQKLIADD